MRDQRLAIQIPISLLILNPENPNDTQSHEGRVLNVSMLGMQVQIDGMDETSYTKLSGQVRLVRASLKHTVTRRPIQLSGSIAWHVYHEAKGSDKPAHCNMGIRLDSQDNVGTVIYADLFSSLG